VLDVGGAAGVYALPLAAQGYQVHLVDPLARHVQQALRASAEQPDGPLASATVGDARQLDRPDASVDAALLFGPLYHLTERADRVRALVEARRVLRPGGVLAGAAISRFASTLDGLLRGYLDEPGFEAIVERDVREGQHRNPTGRPEWFTTAYFHLPEDLAQEVGEAGLRLHAVFAVEGPAWMLPDIERRLADPARRERLLAAIRRVETEPSLLGASAHLGRVPWSGGNEGVVVNLSDDAGAGRQLATSSAVALLTSLGLAASSPVATSLAIEPSDR
jgi:SAM-dependent methyltransferase